MSQPRPTRARLFALACAALLASCRGEGSREPVAGLYAISGGGQVSYGDPAVVRAAKPGTMLRGDATISVDKGPAVLEGLNGAMVALGSGRHRLSSLKALSMPAGNEASRLALVITDRAQEKQVGLLLTRSRYEPAESGKALPKAEEDKETQKALGFFFTPGGSGGGGQEPQRVGPPPTPGRYMHALKRPLVGGDGRRRLMKAQGAVVVELQDNATAIAGDLPLPLDLTEVRRILVAEGSAVLKLPSGEVRLEAGQVAEIAELSDAPAGP